jgi:hypothetical protein
LRATTSNIFAKRLAEEGDETKRETIFKLVAEEKATFDALMDQVDMRLND